MPAKRTAHMVILPCTSLASAPPSVTYCVPGVTGKNQPRGMQSVRISSKVRPASAIKRPFSQTAASYCACAQSQRAYAADRNANGQREAFEDALDSAPTINAEQRSCRNPEDCAE